MIADDFSTLFELLPIGAYRSSPEGRQLRANPALVRLDGYQSEAELLAATNNLAAEWYVDPNRREQFKAELAAHGRVQGFVSEVYRHKTRERIWVRVHAHVVRDAEGKVLYYEGTVEDITHEQQAVAELRASEERFRAMTELSAEWYWELDTDLRFTRLDITTRNTHPGVERQVLGKTRREVGNNLFDEGQWRSYEALFAAGERFYDLEMPIRASDGRIVWHSISGEPMRDAQGGVAGYRGTGRDITAQKAAQEALAALAYHDTLTGLPNRRLLMDRLQQLLLLEARSGQMSVLLFLDLDHFKSINDEFGHAVGDQLLRQLADRIKLCVRAHDTVARLGGDEFVVLLTEVGGDADTALARAARVAEQILLRLRQPYEFGGQALACAASIGAVLVNDPAQEADAYLDKADRAMYQAKRMGRNTFCVYSG